VVGPKLLGNQRPGNAGRRSPSVPVFQLTQDIRQPYLQEHGMGCISSQRRRQHIVIILVGLFALYSAVLGINYHLAVCNELS
jgi:hypothetical protein